ncbi:MAG: hypothetical protein ACKVOK_01360 [Flavobacteriales bacterium]
MNKIPTRISFWKYMNKAKGKALLVLFIIIGIAAGVIWYRLDGKWDVMWATVTVFILWVGVCVLNWQLYLKGKNY